MIFDPPIRRGPYVIPQPGHEEIERQEEAYQNPNPEDAVESGIATGEHGAKVGVFGSSTTNVGVWARSRDNIGLVAEGGRLAAVFHGGVRCRGNFVLPSGSITLDTGDVILGGADCAEEFDVSEAALVPPGTVMVLGADAALCTSTEAYDTRVAGVVAGAGDFKPGIVMDRRQSSRLRQPIALLGKTYCMVDARYSAIAVGDLLTTSTTPGAAMKADDRSRLVGALIGKALAAWREGTGMIPVLVCLR
jgi:hypothetical protein